MRTEFKGDNVSEVIVDVIKEFLSHSVSEMCGVSIKIAGFDKFGNVIEDEGIRSKFDRMLMSKSKQTVKTVANTIFPVCLWNPKLERKTLFDRYATILPKLLKCPRNNLGLYFNRMVNYQNGINQLEKVIEYYKSGNRRRSAFQVSVWDPELDLKNAPRRGFPCLQHVVFAPKKGKLTTFAFYASQTLFERAYGNIIGICNLSKFVAHELDIDLAEVDLYVGVEKLDLGRADASVIVN